LIESVILEVIIFTDYRFSKFISSRNSKRKT